MLTPVVQEHYLKQAEQQVLAIFQTADGTIKNIELIILVIR